MTSGRTGVAALLPVRLQSTRCPNKALRPFGDTTLTRLALDKISRSGAVDAIYFAAHEEELLDLARDVPRVRLLRRSRASALGEDAVTIYDFMPQIAEPVIATWNACAPFLNVETYDRAIDEFRASGCRSLLPVVETREWYFDATGRPLNAPDASIINSKMLAPVYRATHPFTIYYKDAFLTDYRVWHFAPGDPRLFPVAEEEAIDIDTEFQFEVAESLYRVRSAAPAALRP
jgi:CMP-N-acetylneuraminic acid synthetase